VGEEVAGSRIPKMAGNMKNREGENYATLSNQKSPKEWELTLTSRTHAHMG